MLSLLLELMLLLLEQLPLEKTGLTTRKSEEDK